MIRNRYVVIIGSRPLRILLPLLVQLSPAIAVQTGELQDLVAVIRVTVGEILQTVVEAVTGETGGEVMTGAEGQEDVDLLGLPLRPEVSGRQAHQACRVDLVEAINEL